MPFVDIRLAGSATRAQKAAIVADVTQSDRKRALWGKRVRLGGRRGLTKKSLRIVVSRCPRT